MSTAVALLGDSSLDNTAYVDGGKDVYQHCQDLGLDVAFAAQDGGVITSVPTQLGALQPYWEENPDTNRMFVISVGGNDALGNIDLLNMAVKSSAEFLHTVSERLAIFSRNYRKMLELVKGEPFAACTIYNLNTENEFEDKIARQTLKFFNDEITKLVFEFGGSLIDYRLLFNEKADYANSIEPSVQGGLKIANAIKRFVDKKEKIIF